MRGNSPFALGVNRLCDLDGVIDFDAWLTNGTLDLRTTGQELQPLSDFLSVGTKIDVVDVKVSAIDQRTASCSLLVSQNAEARSGRWIDGAGYVGLELRFVHRP
jgi:hypothetical protein